MRTGAYTFSVRACLSAIAGLIDVIVLVFSFVNIRFFWRPIVSAPPSSRGIDAHSRA